MSSTRKRYGGQSDKDLHQTRFLEAFAVSCSVQNAARWAGVHRQCHYDWLEQDPSYPRRFREARDRAAQALEDEAVRRAKDGVRKVLFYKGEPIKLKDGSIATEVVYSDRLLERLLEANDPERFRRNIQQTNINEVDWSNLSNQQLDVLMEAYLKKMVGSNDPKVLESARKQLDAGKTVIDMPGEDVESSPNG
jgi:hypothetical protein